MSMPITPEMVEKALRRRTPHPLKLWHLNADGSISAINEIGQKFILTVETIRQDDLLDAPADEKPELRASASGPNRAARVGKRQTHTRR